MKNQQYCFITCMLLLLSTHMGVCREEKDGFLFLNTLADHASQMLTTDTKPNEALFLTSS